MANTQTAEKKDSSSPAPEVLRSQSDTQSTPDAPDVKAQTPKLNPRLHRTTYRPSHKATFIGLVVVVGILVINAGIIALVMRSQNADAISQNQDEVTLSPAVLNGLGVSRNPIGNAGTELVVGPNSRFNGTVTVSDNVSIGGQLNLNSKLTASDASLVKLEAGDTSLGQLNVNGDGTVTSLNLRKDLSVVGLTRLQGPVTLSQLLTVNNNINVTGSMSVGGTLSARAFQATSLISDTTLSVGGHIITRGTAPAIGPGSALGSNGTVSISGNDASGTVAVNIGAGAGSGVLAQIAFRAQYGTTPHVVITAIGRSVDGVYVNRTIGGFSINVSGALAPGGYAFDYIVIQ